MTEPARVLAWITQVEPWGRTDPPESPAERATHSALMAVADTAKFSVARLTRRVF